MAEMASACLLFEPRIFLGRRAFVALPLDSSHGLGRRRFAGEAVVSLEDRLDTRLRVVAENLEVRWVSLERRVAKLFSTDVAKLFTSPANCFAMPMLEAERAGPRRWPPVI